MACLEFLAAFGAAISGCSDAAIAAPVKPARDAALYEKLDRVGVRVDALATRDILSVYRHNHGAATVSVDAGLQKEAEAQAVAMAKAGVASARVRGPLRQRLQAGAQPHAVAVENISAGYHTLAEAFSGWRDSPPHNANMLNPAIRRIGVATAYAPGAKYKVFWALVLAD